MESSDCILSWEEIRLLLCGVCGSAFGRNAGVSPLLHLPSLCFIKKRCRWCTLPYRYCTFPCGCDCLFLDAILSSRSCVSFFIYRFHCEMHRAKVPDGELPLFSDSLRMDIGLAIPDSCKESREMLPRKSICSGISLNSSWGQFGNTGKAASAQ